MGHIPKQRRAEIFSAEPQRRVNSQCSSTVSANSAHTLPGIYLHHIIYKPVLSHMREEARAVSTPLGGNRTHYYVCIWLYGEEILSHCDESLRRVARNRAIWRATLVSLLLGDNFKPLSGGGHYCCHQTRLCISLSLSVVFVPSRVEGFGSAAGLFAITGDELIGWRAE
jgi:hypothetical protein